MTLKYWLLLWILDNKPNVISLLHIPIDSIVLKKLTNKESFNGKSWSKFNENDYKSCQEECRRLLRETDNNNTPVILLEFDLFNKNT